MSSPQASAGLGQTSEETRLPQRRQEVVINSHIQPSSRQRGQVVRDGLCKGNRHADFRAERKMTIQVEALPSRKSIRIQAAAINLCEAPAQRKSRIDGLLAP